MQTGRRTGWGRVARSVPEVSTRTAIGLSIAVFLVPIAFVLVVPHPLEQPLGVDYDL
jgi:hypothetical protein